MNILQSKELFDKYIEAGCSLKIGDEVTNKTLGPGFNCL